MWGNVTWGYERVHENFGFGDQNEEVRTTLF